LEVALTIKENAGNDSPIESSLNPDISVSIDTEDDNVDKDSADYEADPSEPDTIDPDIINSSTKGRNIEPTVPDPSLSESLEPDEEPDAEEIDPYRINIGTSNPNVGF
jgi:hypothetical protein